MGTQSQEGKAGQRRLTAGKRERNAKLQFDRAHLRYCFYHLPHLIISTRCYVWSVSKTRAHNRPLPPALKHYASNGMCAQSAFRRPAAGRRSGAINTHTAHLAHFPLALASPLPSLTLPASAPPPMWPLRSSHTCPSAP